MATEKLKFKVELFATMWNKPPHAEVLVDNKRQYIGPITGSEDKPTIIEFTQEFESDKEYNLDIKMSGKTSRQTLVNEKGDILKDQLLNIKSIEIDEIDIGALVYDGVFTPEYPEPWASQQREAGHELPKTLKNVTCMGHNGTWTFKFVSPFYIWLLENLY